MKTWKKYNEGKSIQVVIARYNEDLHWLDEEEFEHASSIIVYNKGVNEDFLHKDLIRNYIKLENIGRCDHTYLYHIIENYDDLADMTVFIPGSLETNGKWEVFIRMLSVFENEPNTDHTFRCEYNNLYDDYKDFCLENWCATNEKNKEINPESTLTPSRLRPFGVWYLHYFGEEGTKYKKQDIQGIFAVSKTRILKRPKSFYMELIKDLEVSSNPEVGHYFERAWAAVFDVV